jgi:hypothetical protein
MSSQAFHRTPGGRVREITVGERFELDNLELFDPAAREYDRDEFLQQSPHTRTEWQSQH